MSDLEKKRLKLEIMRVNTAKAELEFKVEERLEDIKRIQDNIKIQEDRLKELQNELDN